VYDNDKEAKDFLKRDASFHFGCCVVRFHSCVFARHRRNLRKSSWNVLMKNCWVTTTTRRCSTLQGHCSDRPWHIYLEV